MRIWLLSFGFAALAACNGAVEEPVSKTEPTASAPTVSPSAEPEQILAEAPQPTPETAAPAEATPPEKTSSAYWGITPGQPLPLKWEDLLPEAAEEEYLRQQAEFFANLEQKYKQSARPLSEANTPLESFEEGSALDVMPQFGTFDVVEAFDGQLIRIPGYVVPLEFGTDQRLAEFLFVPYMGACLHTPPPPPNQIIFVQTEKAVQVKDIWVPYWAEGTLQTQENRNEMGDTAYTLELTKLEPYDYD